MTLVVACLRPLATPNPPNNTVHFRGLDSKMILNERVGILRPIGDFPESLSQAMLAGIMLVGRLGVWLAATDSLTLGMSSILAEAALVGSQWRSERAEGYF